MRFGSKVFSVLVATLWLSWGALAQTSTTGAIAGAIADSTGAIVANAEVELTNVGTNQSTRQVTNDAGQYIFPSVLPGNYTIAVTAKGFRKANITDIKVDVARSYTFNITLEVGDVQQVVEVTAGAVAELQTTDSTVGNVIQGKVMPLLPALTRQANELIRYQPASTPSGEVAGARSDQSTFLLDGIDVTNNSVGGIGTFMQLPIDGVEEFRAGVANPNASFGRGAGGQVSVISRRGSSQFHGATYWYHQNDALNAATWTNKRTVAQTITDPVRRHKTQEPELKDNRFGFRFGGPILPWKDKAYFFLNYEGRRFPRNSEFTRLVPTDTLKQGILRFRDASGTVVSYAMANSALCGPNGDQPCDPRGLGLSPTISALWAKLPTGNDPGQGDGLNTIGFRGNVTNPLTNDYYNARIDYNVTEKWRFDTAFRYFGQIDNGNNLLSIEGGNAQSLEKFPTRQNMLSSGLTGQITSNLIGEFRFGWVRNRTATDRQRPNQSAAKLALPGTSTSAGAIALDIGALGGTQSLLSEPIDVGTQVARVQTSDNRIFQYNADMTWTKSGHTMTFGSHIRYLPTGHTRDDKVVGSLGALVAQIDSDLGAGVTVGNTNRPRTCGTGITTNCLTASDVSQWNRLFASSLGLIDNINVLAVRDAQFKPLPYGEVLVADTTLWAPEFYFQDTWRMRPSLTLTYGLNYGWQTPPKEKLGRQTVQVDGTTLKVQTAREFLRQKQEAAAQGQIFNPKIAFLPVNDAKRDVFDIDWNNLAPRVAAAWNPSSSNKFLGKLFGDRKTVIRGGYSLVFDRQNTVQSVIIPTLG
ncbi:MAG TPA: carboxypeptidase-like regulatory domain-containing protein, partial [Blastocatellia bacterium]|nr:carboxypeptidase-like regulatory domain-containing protein [Blastocatellia bacterium]